MERRRSIRHNVFLNAEIISGTISYAGFACNLSQNGIYTHIKSANAKVDFKPGSIMELKLELPLEERLNLNCILMWSYEIPFINLAGRSAYNLGIKIIYQVQGYKEFYRTLAIKRSIE